ncbi:hypothetical protein [Streptomyces sp. NPDC059994]|uniref:hypothetical protein n=1 Tax=Streptomyces sp. NPDC059994 TaxID=3347029 RepID=UPI003679841F
MTPLERLLAEELPTGTFGDAQPAPRPTRSVRPWTAAEQAAHVAALVAELDQLEGRGMGKPRLRVIDGEAA